MIDFFRGVFYVAQGFHYMFTKGLKRFIWLPIGFNFTLFFATCYVMYYFFLPYVHHYVAMLPDWLGFLSGLLLFVFALGFFLLFFSMFTVLFSLVAAPFNGLLAEKAQNLFCQTSIPALSLSEIAWRTVKRQCQFLGYFLPRFFAMILLFFVPFIHPIYPFLWFWFATWILSLQYQDFVMDNNLVGFQEMRSMLQKRYLLSLGFGCTINVLSFVPILNFMVMPAAVIGSVLLYNREHQKGQLMISQETKTR